MNWKKTSLIGLGTMFLLGGCGLMNNASETDETINEVAENGNKETDNSDMYVSVQEYTGEGYTLPNGEETDRIAEENREQVEEAVQKFFQEEYKTQVKVHNIVGAVDGATVFVESVGKPHFYTYAIIPIDKEKKDVQVDQVWSQQGQVENAIMAGVYGLVFEQAFNNLTKKIKSLEEEYNFTGLNKEAVPFGADRFSNEYFFVTMYKDEPYTGVLNNYLDDPDRTKEEWKSMIDVENIDPNSLSIAINLFMEEKEVEPSKEAFDAIVQSIKEANSIPHGLYSVFLHDNYISINGNGHKDNSLERSDPNFIVK